MWHDSEAVLEGFLSLWRGVLSSEHLLIVMHKILENVRQLKHLYTIFNFFNACGRVSGTQGQKKLFRGTMNNFKLVKMCLDLRTSGGITISNFIFFP